MFLSIFDVHINRAPIGGRITKIEYKPGKFLIAYDERASNEKRTELHHDRKGWHDGPVWSRSRD